MVNQQTEQFAHAKKGFRCFQLKAMGYAAIFIGPITLFAVTVIYGLPFPMSISETATIANKTAPLLPFCLGALALFALTYAIVYAHDRMDRALPAGMSAGFTMVAMQMCDSPYVAAERVGVLGLTPFWSDAVHCAGAVAGFGCMIAWVMFCFTKSGFPKHLRTKEKRTRDNIYFWLGICMMLSLGLFVYDYLGLLGDGFPVVFAAECVMLTFGGAACLVKGGAFLRDSS
jgi:hypothetical protein